MPAKNGSLVASDKFRLHEPLRMGFGREVQGFICLNLPCTRPRDSKPSRRGFSFASRPAYASYGVKSPAAKKDVMPQGLICGYVEIHALFYPLTTWSPSEGIEYLPEIPPMRAIRRERGGTIPERNVNVGL